MVRGFGEQGAISVGEKIKVAKPLVILHGDEMAQIAFERILEQFVTSRLEVELVEVDLSAEKRLTSNGQVVVDAIEALKEHGVGIKNAGMTVNRSQLDDLLVKYPDVREESLDKLATKSPNGAIRKGIGGNITREDIQFRNLQSVRPDWVGRDIEVHTMEDGGIKDSAANVQQTGEFTFNYVICFFIFTINHISCSNFHLVVITKSFCFRRSFKQSF